MLFVKGVVFVSCLRGKSLILSKLCVCVRVSEWQFGFQMLHLYEICDIICCMMPSVCSWLCHCFWQTSNGCLKVTTQRQRIRWATVQNGTVHQVFLRMEMQRRIRCRKMMILVSEIFFLFRMKDEVMVLEKNYHSQKCIYASFDIRFLSLWRILQRLSLAYGWVKLENDHWTDRIGSNSTWLDSTRLDTFDVSSPCILAVSS